MKKYLAGILVVVLVLTCCLTSCATKNKLVGTWISDEFKNDGYMAVYIIEFDKDGTYTHKMCKASGYTTIKTETGRFEIKGDEVHLIKGKVTTLYEYKGGVLTNGRITLNKQ